MKNFMKVFLESGYYDHVQKNADAKNAWAQKAMGDIYYYGIGMDETFSRLDEKEISQEIKENHKEAFRWYSNAAKQNDFDAMHSLGTLYYFGEGVDQDFEKSAEWYRKAADAGDAEAMYILARMYEGGMGVDRNLSEAEKLYLEAINEHAHAESLYPLAQLYLKNQEEFKESAWFVFRLLMGARLINGERSADRDIDLLWDELSPMQHNKMREIIHDDRQRNWNPKMQRAVLGINERMAIVGPLAGELQAAIVFERIWRSVVFIRTSRGTGSGVIVQPDIVATNHHVVVGEESIWVLHPKGKNGEKNVNYPVSGIPVEADGGEDYCLLHVPNLQGSGIPATIRRYNTLMVGETVYALGAPTGEVLSLSKGIISQKRNNAYYEGYASTRAIQSDVDVASGSSGGGLFDSAGNLIGHPTFGTTNLEVPGAAEKGLEFAIPADTILEFGRNEEKSDSDK